MHYTEELTGMSSLEKPQIATLRTLQLQHGELDIRLKERKDVVNMHVAMLNDHVGIDQAQENKGLLQDVYRYQEELRAIYTMELLKKQVDLEEEAEMKAFLLQYQNRIAELRYNLVDKEAEIAYETYDRRRETTAKRENLKMFNHQLTQKSQLSAKLIELKALEKQVNTLEASLDDTAKSMYSLSYQSQAQKNHSQFALLASLAQKDKLLANSSKMLADTMSETAKLEAEYEQIQLELSKRKKDKVTLVAGYQQAQKEWNNKVRADVLKVNLQDDEQSDIKTINSALNSNKSVPSSKSVTTQDSAGGVTSGTSVGEQKHKVTINSSIKIIDDEPINVFQEMCENERQDRQEKGKIATALEIANKDRPTKHAITNQHNRISYLAYQKQKLMKAKTIDQNIPCD